MGNHKIKINNNRELVENIIIKYVSKSLFEEDWQSIIHSHPFTEVFFVINGEGYSIINGKKRFIKKNSIFIVNTDVMHAEYSSKDNPLEYIVFAIEGIDFKFKDQDVLNVLDNDFHIAKYFETLYLESGNNKLYSDKICYNLIQIIIIEIFRLSNNSISVFSRNELETAELKIAKEYLDNNLLIPITLDELSEQIGLNKFYLSHLFTKVYKVSPITYHSNKRIEYAKDLLISTDYTIHQISEILNYSSVSYFSQSFKCYTKLTPSKFRVISRK